MPPQKGRNAIYCVIDQQRVLLHVMDCVCQATKQEKQRLHIDAEGAVAHIYTSVNYH